MNTPSPTPPTQYWSCKEINKLCSTKLVVCVYICSSFSGSGRANLIQFNHTLEEKEEKGREGKGGGRRKKEQEKKSLSGSKRFLCFV